MADIEHIIAGTTNGVDSADRINEAFDRLNAAGTAGNLALLDENGTIPPEALPATLFKYQGEWDPATNTPTLSNANPATPGDFYHATGPGVVNFGAGPISFAQDDFAIWRGDTNQWGKMVNSNDVTSVNGKTGNVTLLAVDVGALPLSGAFGYGQAWVDVTGSRSINTAYLNDTGRPIMVNIAHSDSVAGRLQVSTDGSTWVDVALGRITGNAQQACAVVPPGHHYRTTGAINHWAELR